MKRKDLDDMTRDELELRIVDLEQYIFSKKLTEEGKMNQFYFSPETVLNTIKIINNIPFKPHFIAPTERDSIQFEWHSTHCQSKTYTLEVEIFSNRFEVFFDGFNPHHTRSAQPLSDLDKVVTQLRKCFAEIIECGGKI